jgi:hypothetical protein
MFCKIFGLVVFELNKVDKISDFRDVQDLYGDGPGFDIV